MAGCGMNIPKGSEITLSYNSRRGIRMGFNYMGSYHIIAKATIPFLLRRYLKPRPYRQVYLPFLVTKTCKVGIK